MQLDVLSLITPPIAWRQNNGLAALDHTMWTYLDETKLVYMKGPAGSPWDWYTYDEEYIYLLMTENVWANPATAKIQYAKGVPRYPRYIDYSPDMQGQALRTFSLAPPRTNYLIINADGSSSASSNGKVTCSFYGPVPGAASGSLPVGVDWISSYSRVGAIELLYHREGYGRYKWEQLDMSGKITSSSLMDRIVVQPCPSPVQKIF